MTRPWPTQIIPATDGTPDVTGLTRSAIRHPTGELYLERYDLVVTESCTIRLHHWCGSDDQHAPHDHPWPNATTVLAGRLLEHGPDGTTQLAPGSVLTRPAKLPHRIDLLTTDAWTLFVMGPIQRRWGFHTETGWVHWSDWPHAGHLEQSTTGPSRQW